ncbi:hypothetical protein MOQ_001710 [Trypanosoma cruzi marinkellei]|uniref:Transmembrane protein n=1 Tax=Trypanosoma cruzi marinkellei TaxID=85056 RepID=K2MS37_TRYCR|nr:hypothetical protein MOQ_001710 [Trypanosoma cruzi marinkellei]
MRLRAVLSVLFFLFPIAFYDIGISAQRMSVVPIQSNFTAVISGVQWPRVFFRLCENRSSHSSSTSVPAGPTVVDDEVTRMLVTALRPSAHTTIHPSPTGVTAVFLTLQPYPLQRALQVDFAVVRMMGDGSLAPDDVQLVEQVRRADVAGLRLIYDSNGGSRTDNVAVQTVRLVEERGRPCGDSCEWAVSIVASLFATALLLIPVFMSVVHLERAGAVRDFFLVASYDIDEEPQHVNEFANCEDWGPVELVDPDMLPKEMLAGHEPHMDGIVVVQHCVEEDAVPVGKTGRRK